MLWERRQQFKVPLFSLADAIERALQTEGPVILSYASDNISGGSPGDSTLALQALVEQKIEGRTLLTLVDSQAVAQAIEAGVGQKVTLEVGAKIDQVYSQPVPVTGIVRLISDGQFTYKGPLYTGLKANMGRTVVLQSGGIFLVLSERAISTFDPELYRSVGLEPSEAKIVVVRENGAFRAAYTEIMTEALPLDTPGFSTSNLNLLPFRRVPRPLYPLDRDFSWTPL
jgi:microcystin degradation protein MlrC